MQTRTKSSLASVTLQQSQVSSLGSTDRLNSLIDVFRSQVIACSKEDYRLTALNKPQEHSSCKGGKQRCEGKTHIVPIVVEPSVRVILGGVVCVVPPVIYRRVASVGQVVAALQHTLPRWLRLAGAAVLDPHPDISCLHHQKCPLT